MSDAAEGTISAESTAPIEAAATEEAQIDASNTQQAEPETKPAATQEDSKFAAKFAALSRREKQQKQAEREFQARVKEFETRSAPTEAPKPAELPLEHRLRRNPLETLKELGISYEKLTQIALNDGKLTPDLEMSLLKEDVEKKSKSEIEQLKAELEADRKERREAVEKAAKDQEDRAIQNYKTQIVNVVKANSEKYELLAIEGDEGASEMVFDLINGHYRATIDEETNQGEVMEIEKAAELVEDYLYEEAKKRFNANKFKKQAEASKTQQQTPGSKQVSQSKPSITLSNNNSQVQSAAKRFLSDEESKREVSKLLVWKDE